MDDASPASGTPLRFKLLVDPLERRLDLDWSLPLDAYPEVPVDGVAAVTLEEIKRALSCEIILCIRGCVKQLDLVDC